MRVVEMYNTGAKPPGVMKKPLPQSAGASPIFVVFSQFVGLKKFSVMTLQGRSISNFS